MASEDSLSSRPRNRLDIVEGETFVERRGELSRLLEGKVLLIEGELGRETEGDVLPEDIITGDVRVPVPEEGLAGDGGTLLV